MCKTCRYLMLEHERTRGSGASAARGDKDGASSGGIVNCPLCHSPIASAMSGAERREQQQQQQQKKEEQEAKEAAAAARSRSTAQPKEKIGAGTGTVGASALQRASDNLLARAHPR